MNDDIWIKRVEITNYQSHKYTPIDFVNGLNVLVGESDQGKTAVIRAIRWCLINVPDGINFIRNGENEASVKIVLSNGKTIVRRRDRKNVNEYQLFEGDGEPKIFSSFGKKVPQEILEAHGIKPVGDDVYFQIADQIEGPFMMSLKPKQRAEILGNLDELSRIDNALTEVNQDVLASNKSKKRLEKEEKQLVLSIEKMKVEINRLSVKIGTLKELKEGIESKLELRKYLTKQLLRLKEIQEDIKMLDESVKKANFVLSHWPEDIEERVQQFRFLSGHIKRLKDIQSELSSIKTVQSDKIILLEEKSGQIDEKMEQFHKLSRLLGQLKENEKQLSETKSNYPERVEKLDYTQLDNDLVKYQVLFKHLERLRKIEQDLQLNNQIIEESVEKISFWTDEWIGAMRENGICTECGQSTLEVNHHHAEAVLR